MSLILVCGDRNWTDKETIRRALRIHSTQGDTILQGGNGYMQGRKPAKNMIDLQSCVQGADALAYQVAVEMQLGTITDWPDWASKGLAAGPQRNSQMLARKPDKVVAFHTDIQHSKGTKDMLRKAIAAGISSFLVYKGGDTVEELEMAVWDDVNALALG